MNVTLEGAELATYLAHNLTDLEFELLIRERIKDLFAGAHRVTPNLSESYNVCRFHMSWTDNAHWDVRIGENYNKAADTEGQVLSRSVADALCIYEMKNGNRLSLLLPAPKPAPVELSSTEEAFDNVADEDKKW